MLEDAFAQVGVECPHAVASLLRDTTIAILGDSVGIHHAGRPSHFNRRVWLGVATRCACCDLDFCLRNLLVVLAKPRSEGCSQQICELSETGQTTTP